MFIDKVKITIKAGDGGNGIVSFLRYKGIANGGPDGGDGGNGGSIIFKGDKNKNSLIDFHYQHKFQAEDGARGEPKRSSGRGGKDLIINVPLGTIIKDAETGNIICDIFYDGEENQILKGGEGGRGNAKFTTSHRHTPHFAQNGEKIEMRKIQLELKTIADVGLVGFPNVGKSTLLSKITGAKPKIANYHFTTLSPNLGVVSFYDKTFTVADIPGLIEGASDGAGLGIDFLKHIERTRMLVHIVDISGVEERDPVEDYKIINNELKAYSKVLAGLPMIIVANKCDIEGSKENLKLFKSKIKGKKIYPISALSGEGLEDLLKGIMEKIETLPEVLPIEHEEFVYEIKDKDAFEIFKDSDGTYVVAGALIDKLSRNVILDDVDSLAYFQKQLRYKGVIKELRKAGAKDGDVVSMGEVEFDFID